jgi:hypothetical protein
MFKNPTLKRSIANMPKVTAFNNHTYPTDTTAPEFTVIWQYPPGPVSQPVHAFPHIQADSGTPIQVQDIEHINLDMHWTYGVGTKEAVSTNLQDLTLNLVNANVAMDMFLDSDKKTSQNASKAEYEVMIWFASFGAAAQPIGLDKGIVSTHVLNGTTLLVLYLVSSFLC